mmetsp:Transcript_39060/g.70348  ORF Transcript_39060/g.70348 Transcript_39060/m.70348 type:complete len:249 (+) Transcript_39060:86-832(+)
MFKMVTTSKFACVTKRARIGIVCITFFIFICGRLRIGNTKDSEFHDNFGCTSTFDISKVPDEGRGFLLFLAPKPFDEVPYNLSLWSSFLEGIGHLIIFSNDAQTRSAAANRGISTICVEHTLDGFPRFDSMMAKMDHAQPDGIVAFANSDLEIERSGMVNIISALKWLDYKKLLNLMMPTDFSQPFLKTGYSTEFWFAALTRWDEDIQGKRKIHDAGGFDLWAWNIRPGGPSLLPFEIPPFRFSFGIL